MPPRTSRRRAVTVIDEEDNESDVKPEVAEEVNPPRTSRGKLKSIKPKTQEPLKKVAPQHLPKKSTRPGAAEQSRPPGKPISSFFKPAIQRQKTSSIAAVSPEKLSVTDDDLEAISDDEIDNHGLGQPPQSTAMSKGSSTALAMRKRKFQGTQDLDGVAGLLPPTASQKFRKAGGGDRVPSISTNVVDDKRPWTERFAPVDLSELAVHSRKVADVRGWIESAYRGKRQKVLVLKGAAGTGKTTTIQLLAKELGIELLEWKDTASSDYASDTFVSASLRFEEFVGRGGRLGGLALSADIDQSPKQHYQLHPHNESESRDQFRALLVEEFPSTFSRASNTLQAYRSVISQYIASPVPPGSIPTPIIMVISETLLSTTTAAADSFTVHRLLGPELSANPFVNIIEFNAIAPTILTKSLETIVIKEARKSGRKRTPGASVLKHLAETGDVRSAVSALEFLCLRGDDGDIWSSKIAFTKPKQKQSKTQPPLTKLEEEALKLITNRESSLGIFHSVGKIMYNKRTEVPHGGGVAQPPPWLPHFRRNTIPETDTDSLIDELGTDTSTFISALHENYALSCAASNPDDSLDSLSGCIDNLSDSDLLSLDRFSFGTRAFSGTATDSLRQDELCFQVAVRGMLFNLPNPVHRSTAVAGNRRNAHQMYYPASLRLWRQKEEVEGTLQMVMSQLGSRNHRSTKSSLSTDVRGVESWKRNGTDKDLDIPSQTSSDVKNDIVLTRLPYIARIAESASASTSLRFIRDNIMAVTRISGASLADDEDGEGVEDEETSTGVEQWSTDRPETDPGPPPSTLKTKRWPKKQNGVFQPNSIPVEADVEKLVLEDDDIVDD